MSVWQLIHGIQQSTRVTFDLFLPNPHLWDHPWPPAVRSDTPPCPWQRPQTPGMGYWSPCTCSTASSARKETHTEGEVSAGKTSTVYIHFNFRGGREAFNLSQIYSLFFFFFLRLELSHLKYDKEKKRARERKVRAVYIFHRANTLCVVSKRLWRHGGRMKNRGVQSAPRWINRGWEEHWSTLMLSRLFHE